MKKRLAVLLPMAAVIIAVLAYLISARPWLITNEGSDYVIDTVNAPAVAVFDFYSDSQASYHIINVSAEPLSFSNAFELQCEKGGVWCKVADDEIRHADFVMELQPGHRDFLSTSWRTDGRSLPAGSYRMVIPISSGHGETQWIAAPFVLT